MPAPVWEGLCEQRSWLMWCKRNGAYHVHGVEANGESNSGRKAIVDARADDQIFGILKATLEGRGW